MAERITVESALKGLERAVQEKGADYHDPASEKLLSFVYFVGDEPSCIVGHVLHYHGYTSDDIGDDNREAISILAGGKFRGLIDDGAGDLLERAQNVQDNCRTWGEALDAAREVKNYYDEVGSY